MTANPEKITIPAALLTGLPASLSARFRALGAEGYGFSFRPGERRIFRKRAPVKVSAWTEAHRVVRLSRYPGPWRNNLTPYSVGIMDASFFKSVETIIVCKTPQTGISEAVNNCIAYAADRDPAPALYVYPDEQTARENSRDRIQPMFDQSPKLRKLLTGVDDDLASLRINLRSMPIYLAWAGSAARLANKPIGRLVLDEVDKYPEFSSKREAGPIDLAEKRTTTFRRARKIWKISTPTLEKGPIWQSFLNEAQVVFDFWVICPDCETSQLMEFKNIKWPDNERDPEKIEAENLADYVCPACGSCWDDNRRDIAVRAGTWRARPQGWQDIAEGKTTELAAAGGGGGGGGGGIDGFETRLYALADYLEKYRPKKIGFHLPSWLSHFVGISEIAAAFLKAKDSKSKLRDFKNAYEALPWVVYNITRKEDKILELRDDRPRGVVPGGRRVVALTAGVDTQDYGFFYTIRAWAGGPQQESWLIDHGLVDTAAGLVEILFDTEYRDLDNNQYIINLVIQDAMGHRTAEVYDITRDHRRRHLPYQGARSLTTPWTITQLEFYPASRGKKIPIPGGLKLIRGNSGYYKDILETKLQVSPAAPGAFHLHSETSEDYARQLCAEYIDDKGIWQCRDGHANHYWDCEYMNFVAADILRLKTRTKPMGAAVSDKTRPKPKTKPATTKKKRRFW